MIRRACFEKRKEKRGNDEEEKSEKGDRDRERRTSVSLFTVDVKKMVVKK